ncbi:MAG: AraC family transcriptional regulator [Lachnospiraceae bacterium]
MQLPYILSKPIVIDIDNYRLTFLQCKYGIYDYFINTHYHSEHFFEINYILDGHGTLTSRGVTYPMTPGSFFMHGPKIEHSQLPDKGERITDYCITLTIHPHNTKKTSNAPGIINMIYNTEFHIGEDSDAAMLHILNQIYEENEYPALGNDILMRGLFMQFIVCLVRHLCIQSSQTKKLINMDLNEYRHQLINDAFVRKSNTLTLEELADQIQCSPRQTQRILKQNYDKTFRELKLYYNMKRAATSLSKTNKSIHDIAMECGYSSAEQFSRSFKEYYHTTPKAYRTEHTVNPS